MVPSTTSAEGVTHTQVCCNVTLGQVAALLDPEVEGSTTVRTGVIASCEWWQGVAVGRQCCRSI